MPPVEIVAVENFVFVCHGPSCSERGSPAVCVRLREVVAASSARRTLRICETGCLDHCATGPNVVLGETRRLVTGVAAPDVPAFLRLLIGLPADSEPA
ncbi:MAG: (2Fe-2S) ferredoxin domain-containing protein [Planctomycetota bacterium]